VIARHLLVRRGDSTGFGLLELLIATGIGLLVLAVLLQFAASAHTLTGVQGETADVHQRLRVAIESLRHDLMLAGGGPIHGPSRGPLHRVFPPILPARIGVSGSDPELSFHADRISILYVPGHAPESRVTADMATSGSPVAIDGNAAGCRPASACDFTAGTDVLIYDAAGIGGAHEVFTLGAVDAANNLLTPSAPLSRPYLTNARVAAVIRRTYYLDAAAKRLMVYDGARSDVPLVDHIADLQFAYYGDPRPDSVSPPEPGASNCAYAGSPAVSILANLGGDAPKRMDPSLLSDGPACGQPPYQFDADLLRIRRVSLTVRVEAESAEFRAGGIGFRSPGVSRAFARSVPDLQTTLDVTPRNMGRRIVIQ
jgi:hypothetical protein